MAFHPPIKTFLVPFQKPHQPNCQVPRVQSLEVTYIGTYCCKLNFREAKLIDIVTPKVIRHLILQNFMRSIRHLTLVVQSFHTCYFTLFYKTMQYNLEKVSYVEMPN